MIRLALAACLVACSAPAAPVIANAPSVSSCGTPSSQRGVYLISGHGEISDRASVPASLAKQVAERGTRALRKHLEELRYTVRDLPSSVLRERVPDEAAIVILLAPAVPLSEQEIAALDRYLACGGALVLALDPQGPMTLGGLEPRLEIFALPGRLVDDEHYLAQRGALSDRRAVWTTELADHPTTAATRAAGSPLLLIGALALVEGPHTASSPTTTILIRSPETSWLDLDGDFEHDDGVEQRQTWNVAAAIEGLRIAGRAGFRALVYGDADLFGDVIISDGSGTLQTKMLGGSLLEDGLSWLVGDGIH